MTEEVALDKEVYVQILQKVGYEQGLSDIKIKVTSGSSKGDNYLGQIYRVTILGKSTGRAAELHLILKTSTNAVKRETLPTEEVYRREIFVYNTVLKELERIQDTRNIDPHHKFSFVKCYHASDVFMEEMIVLEDLKVQGFIMADRLKSADYAHAALVMSALGKLHALSYVMKQNQPHLFSELADKCPDILCYGPFGKAAETFFVEMGEMFVSVLENEKVKAKVERFTSDINGRMKVATKPSRFSVIGHGDCWINNMLFKYKNGVPVDIRLLDYQLTRYGSPVLDMLYFIFGCTDRVFRSQHYTDMLDIYHSTLTASLKAHNLDVNDFFSKEDFLAELEQYSDFGLGMAILTLRSFVANSDDATDIEACMNNEITKKCALPAGAGYQRYVKRANDVAQDYVDYGYLD